MKKLIIKIGNEKHELPYNGETFSFEVEEKYVPKVGDCVKVDITNSGCATFFKIVSINNYGNIKSEHCVDLYKEEYTIYLDNFWFSYENQTKMTQITPEELKAKYAEAGYDWNYGTNEVKPLKWFPKDGDVVWYLTGLLEVLKMFYYNDDYDDNDLLKKGLLFPTEAECQKFADHCLKYFDKK